MKINNDRKVSKYHPLINHIRSSYSTAASVDLFMSALGIF